MLNQMTEKTESKNILKIISNTFLIDKIYSYQNCVKNGKYGKYRTDNYKKIQNEIINVLPDNIDIEKDDLLKVNITLFFKISKSKSKKCKIENHMKYCDKHIDLDNVAKLVNDIIFDYYDLEDSNIVSLNIEKYWINADDIYKDRIEYKIEVL